MITAQQRKEHRFGIKIRAYITNPQTRVRYPCLIRDGSLSGCKLTCGHLAKLPDDLVIEIPDLAKPVNCKIMWRKNTDAGVKFIWESVPANERRAFPRQKVNMTATVLDRAYRHLLNCTICDASRSGCRIKASNPDKLPDEICIEIKGLTEPMLARVVWRATDAAGIEFIWDSDAYLLNDPVENNDPVESEDEFVWEV